MSSTMLPNPASAVDGGIPVQSSSESSGPAATDRLRYAEVSPSICRIGA
jgi:hypothetical protein